MSERKLDKGKEYQKLHKLQKKLGRVEENESWISKKLKQIREFKIIERIRGKNKPNQYK